MREWAGFRLQLAVGSRQWAVGSLQLAVSSGQHKVTSFWGGEKRRAKGGLAYFLRLSIKTASISSNFIAFVLSNIK